MRILEHDRKAGKARLFVESPDDLWHLRTLIEPGDTATGVSEYKEKLGGSDAKTQIAKRRVWVTVTVEKVEWSAHAGRIRIVGTVVDGSEEVPRGSHHGLDVGEGEEVTLVKPRWLAYHLERLEEAAKGPSSKTLVVLFDRERAVFVALKPHGHEVLAQLDGDVPKKGWDTPKGKDFMSEIAKHTAETVTRLGATHVIAASPAFWRAELEKALPAELRNKVIFAPVSDPEVRALPEVLARPEVQAALANERVAREREIVEQVLAALAKDRLAYGYADVHVALEEGNVSELIVSESAILKAREDNASDVLEKLLHRADDIRASVRLLSTHEAMSRIDGLGGVVSVKRW